MTINQWIAKILLKFLMTERYFTTNLSKIIRISSNSIRNHKVLKVSSLNQTCWTTTIQKCRLQMDGCCRKSTKITSSK